MQLKDSDAGPVAHSVTIQLNKIFICWGEGGGGDLQEAYSLTKRRVCLVSAGPANLSYRVDGVWHGRSFA